MDWFVIAETTLPWFLRLSAWWTILQVALGLGFVIFVHELGHFLIAKLCGVKCEKFYVGFDVPIKLGWGKYAIRLPASLWKKTWGETTYGIGILPLGGYVKMLGQDDNPARAAEAMRRARAAQEAREQGKPLPEDYNPDDDYVLDPRSYMAQSVPERMGIISAGVIMNLIFAFIFAAVAFAMGVKYTPCIVGSTVPGDAVWTAGQGPGDEIVEIGGVRKPRFWKDLMPVVILEGNSPQGIPAVIRPYETDQRIEEIYKPDQEKKKLTENERPTIGMTPAGSNRLYTEQPVALNSSASRADKPFLGDDTIVEVNGTPVVNTVGFNAEEARHAHEPLVIVVERIKKGEEEKENPAKEKVTITVPPTHMRWFGATMKMGPIDGVQRDSPAAKAMSKSQDEKIGDGLKPGDWLVSIDGQPIGDPITLPERVRRLLPEKPAVDVVVRRQIDGAIRELTFVVTLRDARWAPTLIGPNCPLEVPAMGICYAIESIVQEIAPDSPADKAGIEPGDTITHAQLIAASDEQKEIEEKKFGEGFSKSIDIHVREADQPEQDNWSSLVYNKLPFIEPDTRVKLTVERAGEKKPLEIELLTTEHEDQYVAEHGFAFMSNWKIQQAESFTDALYLGYRETYRSATQVLVFLKKLTTGQVSVSNLGGPGTIVAAAGSQASLGFAAFLIFLTLLSANLAVVNFLPIPVLDGGHMVFLLAELVTGKPVSEKVQTPLMYLGLFLILGLMIFVIGLDVQRFWPFG